MKMLSLVLMLGLAAGAGFVTGCSNSGGSAGAMTCQGCADMKAAGKGWCDHCNKGMVDGQAVSCKGCYAAKTGGPACATCAKR